MKIVKFVAENVKKLKAVEITPKGALVEITGKNGQGKTSILDSIWWALAGAENIQVVPIRLGEKKARIRLDLGEISVERRFTENGSSLIVESADGARYPSPQTMLDKMLGALAFDPLSFVGLEPRHQFEALRKIVPLSVDVDKIDAANQQDYAARAAKNRDAKARRAQADGIAVAPGLPSEKIGIGAISAEMTTASKKNAEAVAEQGRRNMMQKDVDTALNAATTFRAQAAELIHKAEQAEAKAAAIRNEMENAPPIPAQINVDDLRKKLDEAQRINRLIESRERKEALTKEADQIEADAKAITVRMDARTAEKNAAIAAAEMPVDGLGFGDGIVTFNGVPFDQASSADQIKVSLKIAMAGNPKLKVIRIKEGSFLDEDNLALIAKMAEDAGYQVWVERVDSTGKVGIFIEDGSVKTVN